MTKNIKVQVFSRIGNMRLSFVAVIFFFFFFQRRRQVDMHCFSRLTLSCFVWHFLERKKKQKFFILHPNSTKKNICLITLIKSCNLPLIHRNSQISPTFFFRLVGSEGWVLSRTRAEEISVVNLGKEQEINPNRILNNQPTFDYIRGYNPPPPQIWGGGGGPNF